MARLGAPGDFALFRRAFAVLTCFATWQGNAIDPENRVKTLIFTKYFIILFNIKLLFPYKLGSLRRAAILRRASKVTCRGDGSPI